MPRYAAVHNALTAMGYRQVGSLSMGSAGRGERVRIPVRLDAGACTTWVAIGASGVRDISLEVLDPDGGSAGRDATSDPQAAVQVCAEVSGEHIVALTIEEGAGEYLLAAWEGQARAPERGRRATAGLGTCSDPTPIAVGETKSGDTSRGQNLVNPTCAESSAPEVVYSLELEQRTSVRVSVESQFDAMVYLQRDCGRADTEITCNDDYPDSTHSRIEATLDRGTYTLVVDGYGDARGIFSVEVAVSTAPALSAICTGATALVSGTAVQSTTRGAPDGFQGTCAGGAHSPDKVFRLDVAERSRVRIVQESQHDGAIYVRGDCGEPASEIACNDDFVDRRRSLLSMILDPGDYWVVSDGYGTDEAGPFDLLADVVPVAGTGAGGDACAGALPLPIGAVEGDTLRARDDFSGSCTTTAGAPDLVYELVVPRRSRVRVAFEPGGEFQGTNLGAIYLQRTCGDPASEVACGTQEIDAVVAAGTWFVVVDGATANAFGRFRLTARVDDPADLEAACRAAPAVHPGQTLAGSTGGVDRFRSSCSPNAASPENIYKLRVTRRSAVRLALAAGYDAVLYVRRDCMDRATEVACNDDDREDENRSRIEQTFEPGTYFVFVDGFGMGSSGTYTLDTTVTPR